MAPHKQSAQPFRYTPTARTRPEDSPVGPQRPPGDRIPSTLIVFRPQVFVNNPVGFLPEMAMLLDVIGRPGCVDAEAPPLRGNYSPLQLGCLLRPIEV